MQGFIDSFKPLVSRYKDEILLLGCALLIAVGSGILYFQQKTTEKQNTSVVEKKETRTTPQKQTITIDISGAVRHPFVYTFDYQARMIDAIQKAGGLADEADEAFVKRNVNYARIIRDQEKIYIPFLSDTANGFVLENKRIIDYTQPSLNSTPEEIARININNASTTELDQLPGIGKVQSEAIVNGRPYTTNEDLVKNNVIKQSVYDKIKNQISVY
jgi:competence protein ComEA